MELNQLSNPSRLQKFAQYFSESDFWQKVKEVGRKIGIKMSYAALLLFYTLRSSEVPGKIKAIIIGALGYFILPADFMPDFMPFLGFADDLFALMLAITQSAAYMTPDIKFQAKDKLGEWFGEYDEAELVEIEEKANPSPKPQ
jgi:uncharacterized membrane protein YkvA (DUF1232 family)